MTLLCIKHFKASTNTNYLPKNANICHLFVSTYRQHCVKDGAVDIEDDCYTHTTPELRDMTTPVYDTVAVPETTST